MKREPKTGTAEALSLLGLARRGGAVTIGSDATRRAVRDGRARLVLCAVNASPVQRKKLERLVLKGGVPCRMLADRVVLGAAVGAPPLSAVGVLDAGLAEELLVRLGPEGPSDGGS